MTKAIIGKKIGMTQIFDEKGNVVPVTVVEAGPCVVVQKKTTENDGYEAVQVGFGDVKVQRVNKPQAGHFKKADVAPKKVLKEFRFDDIDSLNVGDIVKADVFEAGEKVDLVLAIGPVIMMKNVAATTKPFGVKTTASLNTIMVDGTGMCGGCRVMVGGENKFACVDGPEFDAHEVDFANLVMRQQMYKDQEALEYSCGGHCKCVEE